MSHCRWQCPKLQLCSLQNHFRGCKKMLICAQRCGPAVRHKFKVLKGIFVLNPAILPVYLGDLREVLIQIKGKNLNYRPFITKRYKPDGLAKFPSIPASTSVWRALDICLVQWRADFTVSLCRDRHHPLTTCPSLRPGETVSLVLLFFFCSRCKGYSSHKMIIWDIGGKIRHILKSCYQSSWRQIVHIIELNNFIEK